MPAKQHKIFQFLTLSQRGVTLVELMVAMTIGLFISAGIITLYLGTSQTYRSTEAQGFIQETGRFALDYISQHVRQAGYLVNPSPEQPWIEDYIFGWESGGDGFTNQKAGTDAIRVRHSAGEVGDRPKNLKETTYSFYIGTDASDDDQPTLRLQRKIKNKDSELLILISNVIDMQIQYATGDRILDYTRPILTSQYRNADQLTEKDWKNVFAVKINLMVKSEQNTIVETPITLHYNGQQWNAPDNALYQVFTGYVSIRNRLP